MALVGRISQYPVVSLRSYLKAYDQLMTLATEYWIFFLLAEGVIHILVHVPILRPPTVPTCFPKLMKVSAIGSHMYATSTLVCGLELSS